MANEYRRHIARRVAVQLVGGRHAIEGTLARADADVLVIEGADLIEDNRVGGMEGAVVIERDRVLWVQVV